MNNEYILSYLSKYVIHGKKIDSIGIHMDMYEYIKSNYRWTNDRDGDWYKVHEIGRDAKYSALMVEPYKQLCRTCDMKEFYGLR